MARKTQSARGTEVDFDLLELQSSIENKTKPIEVRDREDFIHTKKRRRGKSSKLAELAKKSSEKNKEDKKESTTRNVKNETETKSKTTTKKKAKRKIVKKETN